MEIAAVKNRIEEGLAHFVKNVCTEWVSLGSTAIQVGALKAQSSNSHAAERIHQVQLIFNTCNVGWVCWEAAKLIKLAASIGLSTGTVAGGVALLTTSVALPLLLNRYFTPAAEPSIAYARGESICWAPPLSQSFGKVLYSTRMVANVALAYLSTTHQLYFVLTALGMGYSLLKMSQFKWIEVSKKFDSTTVYYRALLQPYKEPNLHRGIDCTICLVADPDSYFCEEKHPFHSSCLSDWFHVKSEKFMDDSRTTIDTIRHYTNGVYTGTSHHAVIRIQEKNLPTCPNCRRIPDHSFLEAARRGCDSTKVVVTDPTPKLTLWSSAVLETAYVTYNAFQSSLIWLINERPELIADILAMQHIMIVSDLAALIRDCLAFIESVNYRKLASEEKWRLVYAAALLPIAAGFAVFWLNRKLKPANDLKDILVSHLSLSAEEAQKVTFTWARASREMFSQWIYLLRIGVNGTSIFYSPRPVFKLIHTAFLTFSLTKLSQLPWLRVDRKISAYIPNNVDVKEADVTFYFLPSQLAISSKEKIQSTLKSIYDYTTNFFKGSTWQGWINKGTLYYRVTLPNGFNTGSDAIPYLSEVIGEAYNWWYKRIAALRF